MKQTAGKTGFTMIELILAIAIGFIVVTATMSISAKGLEHTKVLKNEERLHSDAISLITSFDYWIKQANNVTVLDGSNAECSAFSSPACLKLFFPDGSTKIIAKQGTNITVDGKPLNSENTEVLTLDFIKMPSSVRIHLEIKSKAEIETLHFFTTVSLRNLP